MLSKRKNDLQLVASPDGRDESLRIGQDAFLYLLDIEKGKDEEYALLNKNNGVFVLVIDGIVGVEGEVLEKRDAIGLSDISSLKLRAEKNSSVLLVEVPMTLV